MPSYNLRILLETVEGKKTSYFTKDASAASFVNTATDGNSISASIAYGRITGSISCSFQNETKFTGDTDATKNFKQNTLLSASLNGSQNTGSIVFTSLDTEYDRLLRYKFIGEKVTNVLGLPSDQWIYVDQIRLPVDDEANIFQGNANLGNVVITDTLTFAGGSDVNSDVPILIDTSSDRYIKFVDERGISEIALRMGYDVDTDSYEISGSDDFTVNIGGVDKADITSINGHVTASGFIFSKNTDGGNSIITIENSNTDTGTDKGAGIEFKHKDNTGGGAISQPAGAIIAGKDNAYNSSIGFDASVDSNLQFFTTINGTDTERLKIDSNGLSIFTGRISASGDIITTGDVIAENYIVSSTVTQITTSFSSGSTIFGDTPADDIHQFTGSVFITGSTGLNVTGDITASGDISSSGTITAASFNSLGSNLSLNNITASGNISGSSTTNITIGGDLFKTKFVQMGNSSSVIDTFNTGSFRSAKYVLQVISASNYQVSEMLVLHNDGTALNTEYAQINSSVNLINFTTDVNNSNVRLNAAGSFISCSVHLDRTIIPT